MDADALRRALFLTAGNAREIRGLAPGLLQQHYARGLSRGHKAASALRRAHELGQL